MDAFLSIDGSYYSLSLSLISFVTGILAAMGGSGGLVLLPFMILSGFSPAMALGTARFAALGGWCIAAFKFKQADQIRWKYVPFLTLLAVIGGIMGTYLIIDIDEEYVYPIVGAALLIIAPLALFQKDFGLSNKAYSLMRQRIGFFFYFLVMIYGGFFGGGSTIMSIFVLVTFLGFKTLEAHATEIIAWIIMSVISSAIFIYHGQVSYFHALIIFICMGFGSYIGSHIAIQKGDFWVKIIVCIFATVVGVKLLFFH